jgi:hypothetical protein
VEIKQAQAGLRETPTLLPTTTATPIRLARELVLLGPRLAGLILAMVGATGAALLYLQVRAQGLVAILEAAVVTEQHPQMGQAQTETLALAAVAEAEASAALVVLTRWGLEAA